MPTSIDQEIEAIRKLLTTLEPLDPKVRESVLDYVLRRLNINHVATSMSPLGREKSTLPPGEARVEEEETAAEVNIKDLVGQKKPRSAIEMATLVAYYLSNKVPQKDRKQSITTKDIETYFKIAEFKLPTKPQFTLPNTKAAGYLDAIGSGEYKLNPVGYNLVVHSMPKSKKKSVRNPNRSKKSNKKKPTKA